MNWDRIFTSPPPSTGWVLGATDAVIVHRTAGDEIHCAAEDLPAGAFEVGPVGLQSVNSEAIGPALARLKGAAEGTRSAAVITPTSWLRCFLIDIDRPPRKEEELKDVVRWRLKKLLPVAPTDLRLSIVRLPEIAGQRRLLVMAGIERAMDAIESAFKAIGVEVGLITTRLFALVPRGAGVARPSLVIPQKNLIHAVDAVVASLDPLAHKIESGTVMIFAKEDMDAAAIGLETDDIEDALDAQLYVVESLQELERHRPQFCSAILPM